MPVPPTSLPSTPSSPLTPVSDRSPRSQSASLRFTCATATVRQLPILHGLEPTTCPRITRQTTRRPRPVSFHPSSDSSSDESHAYIPQTMSTNASVESTSSKAPVLTGGDVTPAVMMEFENACHDFFEAKSVPAEKQVTFILPGIKDFRIRNWIAADRATIVALPFLSFMTQLCKNSLHPDWEDHVRDEILQSHLQPSKESFWAWSQNVIKLNCLLRDTTSLFDDTTLRNQLDAHLDNDLKDRVKHSDAKKEKTLKTWIDAVRRLDETRISENKRHRELIEETLTQRQSKRQATEANALRNKTNRTNNNTSSATASSASSYIPVPTLLDSERTLLNEHDGCTKCRKFYVEHRSRDCPNGFPRGKGYKTLTAADALTAKRTKNSSSTTTAAKTSSKPVAATAPASDNDATGLNTIAAVLPSISDYTSDSEEDNNLSIRDVSAPVKSKHLIWHCQIHGLTDDFPVKTRALIDNGAHLVLIHPDLIAKLNLKIHHLNKPEPVDVTLNNGQNTHSELYKYVKLSVTSLDSTWTSKTVRALIAPGLCMPMILGLPFLIHNTIVIDHAARSCVDKSTNYNLLNPSPILPPPPRKPCLHKQIKETKADKKIVLAELLLVCNDRFKDRKLHPMVLEDFNVAGAIREQIELLASKEKLQKLETELRTDFREVFEPIPHVSELPTDVFTSIHLKNAEQTIKSHLYPSPCKYKEAWSILIQQHLDAGRIQPSSSPYASPAFIVPKANPNVLPRWVNDYRQLNENTVTDSHPLPRINNILSDCAKGKIWGTIDMTNSFFQTRMQPEHVPLTAVNTPLRLYEWLVMPMGLKNAPAIHQRHVTAALREHLGKFCHIYLDDIVIWSQTLDEHVRNVKAVLDALRKSRLYVNPDKTNLFCLEIDFLGHHISSRGIEADEKKADRIINWPIPKSTTDVRSFLGLVRYLADFLPSLAEFTGILTELTTSECEKKFPAWTDRFHQAFEAIKSIVVGRDCLTTIDLTKLPEYKIFVTTDASDKRSGAILSFGKSWASARPVAFDSMTFKGADLNYPVHEKELLAIIRALKKWRVDLLGSPFFIYTDHKTLENFNTQKDLSRRQARWMELMSQYNAKIIYVKGGDNTVADALSRLPCHTTSESAEETA